MALGRSHKMLLLFVSPDNPIWHKLFTELPSVKRLHLALGRSSQRFSQFRSGDRVSAAAANAVFDNALRFASQQSGGIKLDATKRIERYRKAFHEGRASLYQMAGILGMKPQDAQIALDRIVYNNLPLFPKMYESAKGQAETRAEETVRKYGGVYKCFVIRESDVLVCSLRVRYSLKVASGFAIRCKLNVPKSEIWRKPDEQPYWEYDGFLARRERTMFWTFEKREEHRSDYISLITGAEHFSGNVLRLSGKYLTTGQEQDPSIVTGDVYLERVVAGTFAKIETFMHTAHEILHGHEAVKEIARLKS